MVDSTFVYTHKSYLVNRKRIHFIDWTTLEIFFDNGTSARILSRSHKKELYDLGIPFKKHNRIEYPKTNLKEEVGY